MYRSFWVHPARQDGGRVTSQSKRSFPIQCIEISGLHLLLNPNMEASVECLLCLSPKYQTTWKDSDYNTFRCTPITLWWSVAQQAGGGGAWDRVPPHLPYVLTGKFLLTYRKNRGKEKGKMERRKIGKGKVGNSKRIQNGRGRSIKWAEDLFPFWGLFFSFFFLCFFSFSLLNHSNFFGVYQNGQFLSGKGVFINTLVGWAGQLKIFVVKLFWPPICICQNFFEPPLTSVKNFLTPHPTVLDVKYQFLSSTPIYLVCINSLYSSKLKGPGKFWNRPYRYNLRLYPVNFSNKLCILISNMAKLFWSRSLLQKTFYPPPFRELKTFWPPSILPSPPTKVFYEHSLKAYFTLGKKWFWPVWKIFLGYGTLQYLLQGHALPHV